MNRRFVFITGATGYMGRSLVPALLARDYRVRALVERIKRARLELLKPCAPSPC